MNSLNFFWNKDIYAQNESSKLFLRAMRENISFHKAHCPEYRAILEAMDFDEDILRSEGKLYRIPPLPTLFFKRNTLLSLPENKLRIKATSSGTGGLKSRVAFDDKSFYYGMQMVYRFFSYNKLISPKPCHYIILGFEPSKENKVAAVKTAYGASMLSPALSRTYALKFDGTSYKINLEGIVHTLKQHADSPFPFRFLGFPSYMYFLLLKLKEKKLNFKLKEGSKVLLGGGWKQFSKEEIKRELFTGLIDELLGINEDNIHEFFSVAEHPVPYMKCKNGHFHVPVYSRVITRDINTLKPLPYGETGILNLMTPYVRSMPLCSVMTDDLAVLHEAGSCTCGIPTASFELKGRAGVSQIKTCAANILDIGEKL